MSPVRVRIETLAAQWERSAIALPGLLPSPPLSAGELWEVLVRAAAQYRPGGDGLAAIGARPFDIRFSVDHALRLTDVGRLLPHPEDGSIEGWIARAARALDGRPFELIVNEAQSYSSLLWRRLRQLLAPLAECVDLASTRAEAALFVRTQTVTTLGVHRDDASVLLFPLAGTKTMLVWPSSVLPSAPVSTLDYGEWRPRATVLTGGPGDALYWPSDCWHVGESNSSWTASLNLGFHLGRSPASVLAQTVRELLEQDAGGRAEGGGPGPDPADLLGSLRRMVLGDRLERALRSESLARRSAMGFTRCPGGPSGVSAGSEIQQAPDCPVLAEPWGEGQLLLAANGRRFQATATPAVDRLLAALRAGERHTLESLAAACAGSDADEERYLRTLLERLVAAGAVEARTP